MQNNLCEYTINVIRERTTTKKKIKKKIIEHQLKKRVNK